MRTSHTRSGAWANWGGNQRATLRRTTAVHTEGDLVAAVQAAAREGLRVKPLGSGHSFTPIAVTDGVHLDLSAYDAVLAVDRERCQVTVQAGTTLHALNRRLDALGLALPNLGDIDAQTISGAVSTATHGTGLRCAGIADAIVGFTLVTADAATLTCTPEENPDVLELGRVGLGALGVLSTLTLQCVPAFWLHALEEPRPLDAVLADLDATLAAAEHFELYWFPHTTTAATKTNTRVEGPSSGRGRLAGWVADELLGNAGFALLSAVGDRAPRAVPALNRTAGRLMARSERVARSHEVFCSPRRVRFVEMEYAVPLAAAVEAVRGVQAAAQRHAAGSTFPVEVRFLGASDIPLSPAVGRETCYVAVHAHRGQPHEAYFGAVEELLVGLGGRPHWGKLHTRTAEQLRASYPRMGEVVALRDRLDSAGVFANPHLDRVLGPAPDRAELAGARA